MLRKNRNCEKRLLVNGVIVDAVTIAGLARIVGKSRDTIERYEKNDTFPLAPIKTAKGVRYYPISLARRLVPLVAQIPRHKKPDVELLIKINKLFKEEKEKLCQ